MLKKWLGSLLIVLVAGTAFAAEPLVVESAKKEKKDLVKKLDARRPMLRLRLAMHDDRPLMQLIQGQIGRCLVLRSELNLSSAQKLQMLRVLRDNRDDLVRVGKGVWDKRQALVHQILAEKSDEAAIRKAADELGKAIGDAAVVSSKLAGGLRPILTSEQRELVKEFREDSGKAVEKFFTKAGGAAEKSRGEKKD